MSTPAKYVLLKKNHGLPCTRKIGVCTLDGSHIYVHKLRFGCVLLCARALHPKKTLSSLWKAANCWLLCCTQTTEGFSPYMHIVDNCFVFGMRGHGVDYSPANDQTVDSTSKERPRGARALAFSHRRRCSLGYRVLFAEKVSPRRWQRGVGEKWS